MEIPNKRGGKRMKYPMIPKTEFLERQRRVQEKMKKNDVDLLITYSDDGAVFGQQYTRWLFNYQPHFEPAIILIPSVGEPVLLTGVESEEYVYASSYCENVAVVDEFVYEAHEFPFSNIIPLEKKINEVINDAGIEIKSIGIAGMNIIPHRLYQRIENIFGSEKMSSADDLMMELREVKSESEIKVIEYTYHIAQKGMEAALEAISAGKTEREIAAIAESVMRNLGSEGMGIDTIIASGKKNSYPIIARTSFREIQKNDLVSMTIAPRYEGYHGAIARPVIVGDVGQEVEHAIDTAIQAQAAAKELLKAGVKGYRVDAAAREVVEAAGLIEKYVYTGIHSIGVSEFEPPSLNSQYTDSVKENMIYSIDIPLFFNEWGGLRYEDGFHVTKEGARPLQTLDNRLIKI